MLSTEMCVHPLSMTFRNDGGSSLRSQLKISGVRSSVNSDVPSKTDFKLGNPVAFFGVL